MTESGKEPQSEHLREVKTQPSLSNSKPGSPFSGTPEVANHQQGELLTPSRVMSLHTKRGAVAKLIGKKALIHCNLNGLAVKALLDTGAQVSIISRQWKDRHLPDLVMRPLSEIIEGVDGLKVCAVNGEPIPFDGWIPIMINLPGGEDPSLSISTLVLVSTLPMDKPLIGFNVLEQIIEGYLLLLPCFVMPSLFPLRKLK